MFSTILKQAGALLIMSHTHPVVAVASGEEETQADARNLNSRRSMDLVRIVKKAVKQVPGRSIKV